MKKLFMAILSFFLMADCVMAQNSEVAKKDTSYWKHSGVVGVNFSQAALVNWVAGGENSVALNFNFNGALNYAKDKWSWDNTLNLQYGVIYSDEYNWRKSIDKIALTSKLGYKIKPKWYASLLFDYSTQFAKGYDYSVSNTNYLSTFMAPAYLNLALGLDYKPNDKISVFFSPATLHAIYVLDDSLSSIGSYGLDAGKKSKYDVGALLKVSLKKKVMENVDVISTFDAFTPYSSSFGNVDLNWDLLANFKINKLLTATLNTTLRYYNDEHYVEDDVDKGARIQFKELFGLGLAYKF